MIDNWELKRRHSHDEVQLMTERRAQPELALILLVHPARQAKPSHVELISVSRPVGLRVSPALPAP